jgi:hypothetical protein
MVSAGAVYTASYKGWLLLYINLTALKDAQLAGKTSFQHVCKGVYILYVRMKEA